VAKRKIPDPVGNRNPVVQIMTQLLYWLSYPGSKKCILYP